jgi:hypothetical protein
MIVMALENLRYCLIYFLLFNFAQMTTYLSTIKRQRSKIIGSLGADVIIDFVFFSPQLCQPCCHRSFYVVVNVDVYYSHILGIK